MLYGCIEPLCVVIRMCTVHSYMTTGPSGEKGVMFCQSRRHCVHQRIHSHCIYSRLNGILNLTY